ncbi:UNVERIFIED_CONTAM: hypothetical protein NCL1_09916 [Trichonephila clavipes]
MSDIILDGEENFPNTLIHSIERTTGVLKSIAHCTFCKRKNGNDCYERNVDDMMETKKKSPMGLNLKNLKTTEKRCKKCGFVTFCLRVLYTHKGKCQGRLLGSLQHKRTCAKFNRKKSVLFERNSKEIRSKQPKISKKTVTVVEKHTIACPVCLEIFSSREKYDVHVRKGSCDPKKPFKKQNFSARKSISKGRHEVKQPVDDWPSDKSLLRKKAIFALI